MSGPKKQRSADFSSRKVEDGSVAVVCLSSLESFLLLVLSYRQAIAKDPVPHRLVQNSTTMEASVSMLNCKASQYGW